MREQSSTSRFNANRQTVTAIKYMKHKDVHLKLTHSLRPSLTTSAIASKKTVTKRHVWSMVFCASLVMPSAMFFTGEGPHHLICNGYAPATVSTEATRSLTTKPVFVTMSYTCWGTNTVSAKLMHMFGAKRQCSISVNGKTAVQATLEDRVIKAKNREATEFDFETGIMTATLPRYQHVMGAERALIATCKRQWF